MRSQKNLNRKDGIIVAFIAALIFVSVIYVLQMNQKINLGGNEDSKVFSQLRTSNKNHNEYVNKLIQEEYGALHSMALYFESKEDFDFRSELDLVNSIMLAEHYKFIGYADLKGNVIGYEGTAYSNVADTKWFQKAASWKGYDSIEFLSSDEDHAMPHIHMASPVRKYSSLVGVLCVSIGAADFNDKLAAGNFNGSEVVFITDSQGNIILSNKNVGDYVFGSNLLEILSDQTLQDNASSEQILKNLENGDSGQLKAVRGEMEYIAYSPLGLGDWTIFSMVPSGAANEQFSVNMEKAEGITRSLSIAFLTAIALVCVMLAFCAYRSREMLGKLKQQEDAYKRILAAVDSAIYDYDVVTRELSVSEGFAEMFGYSLPKDFFAKIPELAPRHPEFDYGALQEKVIAVEMNRRQEEINLVLQSKTRGMARLQITMVPQINSENRVVGIHGVISDVTNSYTDNLNLKQDHKSALMIIAALEPMALSANLTQNTYRVISYNQLDLRCVLEEGSYDDLIARGSEHVHGDDKKEFLAAFSRENLLKAFADGQSIVNLQHRIINDSGELRWVKSRCVMVHSELDGSVHLALVLTDNTEHMERQELKKLETELQAAGTMLHNPAGAPTSAATILTKTGEIAGGSARYPKQGDDASREASGIRKVFAKTFGTFDIFLDDKPMYFTNAKAKELLAILIDRKGGTLASSEAISLLWEDEPAGEKQLARYRRLASRLKETLRSAGCGNILISSNGIRSINISKLSCDYYQAVDGDEAAQKQYQGFYMTGYSWAEERNVALNRMFGIDNSEA